MEEDSSQSSATLNRPLSPLSIDLWRLAPAGLVRNDPGRRATRIHRGHTLLPQWELKADYRSEVLRVYALTYIPAGFWTRLITRLLTDSNLNTVCG